MSEPHEPDARTWRASEMIRDAYDKYDPEEYETSFYQVAKHLIAAGVVFPTHWTHPGETK